MQVVGEVPCVGPAKTYEQVCEVRCASRCERAPLAVDGFGKKACSSFVDRVDYGGCCRARVCVGLSGAMGWCGRAIIRGRSDGWPCCFLLDISRCFRAENLSFPVDGPEVLDLDDLKAVSRHRPRLDSPLLQSIATQRDDFHSLASASPNRRKKRDRNGSPQPSRVFGSHANNLFRLDLNAPLHRLVAAQNADPVRTDLSVHHTALCSLARSSGSEEKIGDSIHQPWGEWRRRGRDHGMSCGGRWREARQK